MNHTDYNNLLKKDALYFRIASTEIVFGSTLKLEDIWKFIRNLSDSYLNFIEVDFKQQFSEKLHFDQKRIGNAVRKLKEYSKLRLVALEFDSFCFGVSSDVLMGNDKIELAGIAAWRKTVLPNYKAKVLDVDYFSEAGMAAITANFSEKERKFIFGPLIKTINDKNYSISLTAMNFKPQKTLRPLPQSTLNELFPEKKKEVEHIETELVQVILSIDKNKNKITISRAQLENDLFTKPTEKFAWTESEIQYDGRVIPLAKAITYQVEKNPITAAFQVVFDPLEITFQVEDFAKIRSEFYKKFIILHDFLQAMPKAPKGKEKKQLAFFDTILEVALRE